MDITVCATRSARRSIPSRPTLTSTRSNRPPRPKPLSRRLHPRADHRKRQRRRQNSLRPARRPHCRRPTGKLLATSFHPELTGDTRFHEYLSARTLTRGNPLGAVGLMSYVNPSRHIYSAIANEEEKESVLGGIIHTPDETFAKLYYLAPASQLDHPYLPDLIETLSVQAGMWGAFHVLAEVDETGDAFVPLRKAGFSVYAWQRMWDISEIAESTSSFAWSRVKSDHLHSVQNLYHQIVPPLLHPVEPQPRKPLGWMCRLEQLPDSPSPN
jgi:hypothetical protein